MIGIEFETDVLSFNAFFFARKHQNHFPKFFDKNKIFLQTQFVKGFTQFAKGYKKIFKEKCYYVYFHVRPHNVNRMKVLK